MDLNEALELVMGQFSGLLGLMLIYMFVIAAWRWTPGNNHDTEMELRKAEDEAERFKPTAKANSVYNVLYMCDGCGKYSRRHNQELAYWTLKLQGVEAEPVDPRSYTSQIQENKLEMSSLALMGDTIGFNVAMTKDWMHTRVCPNCLHAHRLHLSYDTYPWLDTLPEALALDEEGVAKFVAARDGIKEAIKEMESIDAFKKYHGLDENEKAIAQLLKKREF